MRLVRFLPGLFLDLEGRGDILCACHIAIHMIGHCSGR